MESLEGKRGYPRIRRRSLPWSASTASPTVINNVETLSTAPREIHRRGGEWYAGLGTPKNGGTRLYLHLRPRQ
jgi:NADH-quinone oxidoreductase subunit F